MNPTQQELAATLGLHQSQVSRYVRRGMPLDLQGAKAWIFSNIRLTMRSPQYRPQAAAKPAGTTPGDLLELAVGMVDLLREMNPADPEFTRGCRLLMGAVLTRLPEATLQAIALPPFVAARIEALIDAHEATP